MNLWRLRRFLRQKDICIPILILLILFVLTYFAEITHVSYTEGYDVIRQRSSGSFIPDSSDLDIVVRILNLKVSKREVDYSFYVHAWLDINTTEIEFHMATFHSYQLLSMKNSGVAVYDTETGETWGNHYQVEAPKQIEESISGFPQKYPYDHYSLSFSLTFYTEGLKPNFNESFQPTMFIPVMDGWKTETYCKAVEFTDSGFKLDIRIAIVRDTLTAVLQFMIPTTAIYFLMGCSLFIGSNDRTKELRDRITICLTTSVLTLSLYTFLLRQVEWIPLYIQNLAISLVVSNVAILGFSIIDSSDVSRSWDIFAMVLASITPILYLIMSGYSSMGHLFHFIVADPLWIVQRFLLSYVDYRFLLWLIIFQLSFWAVYLYKKLVLQYVTLTTGFALFFINCLRSGVFQEAIFTFISIIMIIFSLVSFFTSSKERPKQSMDYVV